MERAIVLGASAAGMFAAKMLARHAREVVVLERDPLDTASGPRRGVPQGAHIHALLTRGQRSLERYFPGLRAELIAAGAVEYRAADQLGWLGPFGFRPRMRRAVPRYVSFTRPFLDAHLLRALRGTERVTVRGEAKVQGLLGDPRAVRGVRLEGGEEVLAELVVDASGRGSSLPKMLEAIGAPAPSEVVVDAGMQYASAILRPKRPLPNGWRMAFVLGTTERPRGGAIGEVEGDRMILSLLAPRSETMPKSTDEILAWARTLRASVIADVVEDAEWLTPVTASRSTASRRRRYDEVRLPDGLCPIADATCAFNPIYGQGITVAALETERLDDALASERDVASAVRRAQKEIARIIDAVWATTTAEDFRMPGTTGPRPFGLRLMHAYVDRIFTAAARSPEVVHALDVSFNLEDFGEALRTPKMIWTALRTRPAVPLGTVEVPDPTFHLD